MSTKFRKHTLAIVMLAVTFAATNILAANPGDLDPAFGAGGKVVGNLGRFRDMAVQPDGRIVVVGGTRLPDGLSVALILRYTASGSLDPTFGSGTGVVRTRFFENDPAIVPGLDNWFATAVTLQPDGKIVVAGPASLQFHDPHSGWVVARYNVDGSLDASFARDVDLANANPPGADYEVLAGHLRGTMFVTGPTGCAPTAMAVQANGQLLIGSGCLVFRAGSTGSVIRLNANGTPDIAYGAARAVAGAIAIQNDQSIVVAGSEGVARLLANGQLDTAFGANALASAVVRPSDVVIQPNGKMVAAGTVTLEASGREGFAVVRHSADGTLDVTFGSGGITITDFAADFGPETSAYGSAVALQADGKIIVAGNVIPPLSGLSKFAIARYKADGGLDNSFGIDGKAFVDFTSLVPGSESRAQTMALNAVNGKIIVGGSITGPAEDAELIGLARFLGGNNTQPGINTTVAVGPATLTFSQVTAPGDTTVTISASGPPPPSGFQLGDPATFYEIATTATVVPPIMVCLDYTGIAFVDESLLRLTHFESGVWVDHTITPVNTAANIICANVMSLSPFAIFEGVAPADSTPPLVAASATPSANGSGWNNSNVTVIWSVTDAESGIATSTGCESMTLTSETGGTTINCTATNGAGLTATESITIRIDKTPPLITASAPQNGAMYLLNQAVLASYTCADVTSGLASCVGARPSGASLPTGVAGAASFAIQAADIAGNTAATSIGYTVLGSLGALKNVLAQAIVHRAQVTDKKDLKTLDDVIEHLKAAVKPSLWIDETHVKTHHGEHVFEDAGDAVQGLVKLLPRYPTLRNHMDRIVASTRLLAAVAIADATAKAKGKARDNIKEANRELARGDADLAAGKFENAIKRYVKAWDAALDNDDD